ncbi:hypothetical protein [Legionella maceachernii]|nr:hypothetical protein [Legionella maceachernii]
MGLLPRVGRSFATAQDDKGGCRPERSEGSPLGVAAKSQEVLFCSG